MIEFNKKDIPIYLLIIFAIVNTIFNSSLFFVNVFVLVAAIYVLLKQSGTVRKNLYYITLILSLTGYNLKLNLNERIGVYYFAITLAIYALVVLYEIITKKMELNIGKLVKNKYLIFLVVFVLYGCASFFWSIDKKDAFLGIYNYAIMVCFLLMVVIENSRKEELDKSLKLLLFMFCELLVLGLLQIMGVDLGLRTTYKEHPDVDFSNPIYLYLKRVAIVFYYNPNNFALILGAGLAFISGKLIYSNNKKEKIFLSGVFLITLIEIIFTRSRTAWITVFAVFIAMFVVSFITKDKRARKGSIALFLVSFMTIQGLGLLPSMAQIYGKANKTPILNDLSLSGGDKADEEQIEAGGTGSMSKRSTLMANVIKGVIEEKNYLGFGVNNIGNYIESQDNTHGVINIHNYWFEILGDFGVIILAYFVFICACIGITLINLSTKDKRNLQYYTMAIMGCVAIALLVLTPSTVSAFIPFWLTIAIIYCISQINAEVA